MNACNAFVPCMLVLSTSERFFLSGYSFAWRGYFNVTFTLVFPLGKVFACFEFLTSLLFCFCV